MDEGKVERSNARITKTMLGIEDHGFLTFFVYLDYGISGQAFGGHVMDNGVFAARAIRGVLETVGVDRWEALAGCHVRAEYDHGRVHRIGHIIHDKWLSLKELGDEIDAKDFA